MIKRVGLLVPPNYKVNNSVAVGNSARAHGGSGVNLMDTTILRQHLVFICIDNLKWLQPN